MNRFKVFMIFAVLLASAPLRGAGVLVCFHDSTLTRTTGKEGRDSDYAATDLKYCRKDEPVRILGVGNSWTRDAIRYLCAIGRSTGRNVVVGHAYLGGSALIDQYFGIDDVDYAYNHHGHKQLVHGTYQYWKYDNSDDPVKTPATGYDNGTAGIGVTLESVVTDEPWDIVILQPEGSLPLNYGRYMGKGGEEASILNLKKRISAMMPREVAQRARWGIMVPFSYPEGNEDYRKFLYECYNGGVKPESQEEWDRMYLKQYDDEQWMTTDLCRSINASFKVNVGFAIRAAREDGELSVSGGYKLQRSKSNTHLSEGLAMYIASLAYAYTLLDITPSDIKFNLTQTADPQITGDRGETVKTSIGKDELAHLCEKARNLVYCTLISESVR